MEQLINSMLANVQVPQKAPAPKKSDAPQKDDFQKLMEQKQGTDAPEAPRQDKAETPQDAQEPQEAPTVQEAQEPAEPSAPKGTKELEEQMLLAAMAMMQNPVVPAVQVLPPAVQQLDDGNAGEGALRGLRAFAGRTLLSGQKRKAQPFLLPQRGSSAALRVLRPLRRRHRPGPV